MTNSTFTSATTRATSADQNGDADRVRALVENWAAAVRRADMAGVLAHHATNIVMFDVPAPVQFKGIDAYRGTWDTFFAHQGQGAFDLSELELAVGGDVAFCHAIVACGPTDPAGQFPVRLTVGLRKVDGA